MNGAVWLSSIHGANRRYSGAGAMASCSGNTQHTGEQGVAVLDRACHPFLTNGMERAFPASHRKELPVHSGVAGNDDGDA